MEIKKIESIIQKYFNRKDILVKHIIDSYDSLLDSVIPNVINQYFPINIKVNKENEDIDSITIECIKINTRPVKKNELNGVRKENTPDISRLRNDSYNIAIYININVIVIENNVDHPGYLIEDVLLGQIPIIVGSNKCITKNNSRNIDNPKYDIGGYLILNGNEKAIISQERISNNQILVYKNNKKASKYSYISECRSCKSDIYNIPKLISIKITNKPNKTNNLIYITIPNVNSDIPICILFRALGCIDDKEIIYNIIDNSNTNDDKEIKDIFYSSLMSNRDIFTQHQALEYISRHINFYSYNSKNVSDAKINYLLTILDKYYLPHVENKEDKIKFTGLMINILIKSYLSKHNISDRDSYLNKRIDPPGYLLGNLFIQGLAKTVKEAKGLILKEMESGIYSIHKNKNDIINCTNVHKLFKSSNIDNIIKNSVSTGSWGMKTNNNKQGVSQVLNRLTYMSTMSHLRRVATSPDPTGKLVPPRKLHNTAWGMICPSETPEGQAVGLVKNLAMTAEITLDIPFDNIIIYIDKYIVKLKDICIYEFNKTDHTMLFINGNWLGYIVNDNIKELLDYFKLNRELGNIHPHTSISINNSKICIYTDRGRFIRPLLKVNNNKLLMDDIDISNKNWKDLIMGDNFCIEYIDIYESNNCLIATSPQDLKSSNKNYTHCEIHPSLILGVLASCIPFANHNQSPRNTYQSAMGKQAIGINITNIKNRYDTFSHVLSYPQRPLIETKIMKHINLHKLPNGINVIVAIASYGGYNQEDSILFNKSAIERGLFNSTFYRCYREEEKKNQLTGEEDIFCKPDISNVMFPKPCNYDKLEETGFIKPNTYVNDNDILIGKQMPIKHDKYKYRDNSINIKQHESGYLDSNYIDKNCDGYKFCKVKIRRSKIPVVGDKFSSRHGQKGTVGMIYDHCDMPFTSNGVVPDIIINPHAIPSRMTIAQLMECILGKVCCETGNFGDATSFENIKIQDIEKNLTNLNYEKNGNEVLYNGMSGEQMKVDIFMGPTYYQRLKHMSEDKIHSRSTGPVVSMTRQPAEGRSSGGGLRFGEMERDCMIASGASYFLKERLCDVSDKFTCFTCKKCGLIAVSNKENIYECKNCNNFNMFNKIYLPYSCKLLFQELNIMSIGARMISN